MLQQSVLDVFGYLATLTSLLVHSCHGEPLVLLTLMAQLRPDKNV